jgi:predicted DNA-binding transcriptional regulator AlpA
MDAMNQLPETGFIRLRKIIGDSKHGIPPLIPISKSTWWQGCRSGRFLKLIHLSSKYTAWRVEDIRALIEQS